MSADVLFQIHLVLGYVGLPALAGQLGAAYVIPVIYVPALMITHFAAFYLLVRPLPGPTRTLVGEAAASS